MTRHQNGGALGLMQVSTSGLERNNTQFINPHFNSYAKQHLQNFKHFPS